MFSYFWYDGEVFTYPDTVKFDKSNEVLFYHQNDNTDLVFDLQISMMKLDTMKDGLYQPTKDRIFGGKMLGEKMVAAGTSQGSYLDVPFTSYNIESEKPVKKHSLEIYLKTMQQPCEKNGVKVIEPLAVKSGTISNYEIPQLYTVFPWSIYGVGDPDVDVAINTWEFRIDLWGGEKGTWNPAKELWYGWGQQAIFFARMGLTDEAKSYVVKKLDDARGNNDFNSKERMRFPSFWGLGHDWTPDHNWAGIYSIFLKGKNNEDTS